MEKFLEKIKLEIEHKMLACIKGESIVKPFSQIYMEVRKKVHQENKIEIVEPINRSAIYPDGEASIYASVVKKFLEEHPELREKRDGEK